MSTNFNRIGDHFRNYLALYLTALGLVLGSWWMLGKRQQSLSEISSWPGAQAVIVTSEIQELPHPDDIEMRTRIVINLTLRFNVDGIVHEARFHRTFNGPTLTDYRSLLAKGKEVQIHYDPNAPTRISLAPLLLD